MIIKPRGTMDIMPEETPLWQYVENKAREISSLYGFGEIRFPTFEQTELFARGVGDTTDVVQKEMYTFFDKDNRSMTLRPEGTASIARSIVENGRCSDAMPLKLYYLISCFRYEKPASGRYREFYQYGVEMYGSESACSDASVIALADAYVKALGISDYSLEINSIGCKECRPAYKKALTEYYQSNYDVLCDTCKGRLKTNPLRILDCKCPQCASLAKDAPKTLDFLCEGCREHMQTVQDSLEEMGVAYKIDTGIVRGLDYYTKTVFEIIGPGEPDKDGNVRRLALGGGGRYDGLVQEIGGPRLPGVGFAMGLSRLIIALQMSGIELPKKPAPVLYIASLGKNAQTKALSVVQKLRHDGIYAESDLVGRSLKAQMKYADKIKAEYTAIIGDDEIEKGKAILRNMNNGEQTELEISALAEFFTKGGIK